MDYIIQLNYYNYLNYNDYIKLLLTTKKYYFNMDYNNDLIYKYYLSKKFSDRFIKIALPIIYSYYDCFLRIIEFEKTLLKYGYPLWVVYVIWLTVVLILYPLCHKYMKYKSNSKKWWLSYL